MNLWGCLAGAARAVGMAWKLANLEETGRGVAVTGRLCLRTGAGAGAAVGAGAALTVSTGAGFFFIASACFLSFQ